MKRIQIFLAFFLMLFVFSCQNVQEGISPVEKTTTGNQRIAACIPSNFYPAITSSSALFKYRYAVALYRYYSRIYSDYQVRESSSSTPPQITTSDLSRLQVSEVTTTMANLAKSAYFNPSVRWTKLTEFIDAGNNLPTSTQQAIVNKGNTWDGTTTTYGSYTIIFQTPVNGQTIYSGKGGGTTRCEQSANARCSGVPLIADYQKTSASYVYPFVTPTPVEQRQAFKEEAVRMYQSGFQNSNVLNRDYVGLITS
jgi:hypothetical protein